MDNIKKHLRQKILVKLRGLSEATRLLESQAMTTKVMNHQAFIRARSIAIFISMPHEICTRDLIRASLLQGKRVFVPKTTGKTMRMLELKNINEIEGFERTKWGIPEPSRGQTELSEDTDALARTAIIVPGIAFNSNGARLGYGGGYYDRYLAHLRDEIGRLETPVFTTIGIGFACQLLKEALPTHEADYSIDAIITG